MILCFLLPIQQLAIIDVTVIGDYTTVPIKQAGIYFTHTHVP